jgi:hypothetical protein
LSRLPLQGVKMQAYRAYAKSFTTKQGRMNRLPKCKVIFKWALRPYISSIFKVWKNDSAMFFYIIHKNENVSTGVKKDQKSMAGLTVLFFLLKDIDSDYSFTTGSMFSAKGIIYPSPSSC